MSNCLILYASETGNTEKIAGIIETEFVDRGWSVDMEKVKKDDPFMPIEIDFESYAFICVGSWVCFSLPVQKVIDVLRRKPIPFAKVVPGPKCALAFATYSGSHLGPREAEPCLTTLEVLYEHLGFYSLGSIAIPGRFGEGDQSDWFHSDLRERPGAEDFANLSHFMSRIFDHPRMLYACANS